MGAEWTTSEAIEVCRTALMREHGHDWDMETISEAAHVCANALLAMRPDWRWCDTHGSFTGTKDCPECKAEAAILPPRRITGEPPGWEGTRATHDRSIAALRPAHPEMTDG